MTSAQKESIRKLRRRGLSFTAIADAVELSPNTVKSFCRRESMSRSIAKSSNTHQIAVPLGDGLVTCNHCGAHLQHHPGKKKKRFCSDKCRFDWWNMHRSCIKHAIRGEAEP